MKKLYKFIEYGYLLVALILFVETILNWSSNRQKSYFFLAFSILALGMHFFKKYMRRRIENHDKKHEL